MAIELEEERISAVYQPEEEVAGDSRRRGKMFWARPRPLIGPSVGWGRAAQSVG